MTEHFVDAEGVRLRVVEDGAGPDVFVLHGLTGDAESMQSVSANLSDRYRVLRLELVGHGKSESPCQAEAYAMEACVAQVLSVVAQLGRGRPHLMGYSMGGRAALSAAVHRPNAFASLVLVGASGGIEHPALRRERVAADEALAQEIEEGGLEAFVDRWMALPLFASQARLGPVALAAARKQRLRGSAAGLAGSLRGMGTGAQAPLHDSLASLHLPTLLVVGEEDEKFLGVAQDLLSRLPNAALVRLAEAGHAAHLEAPGAFATCVTDFWSAQDRSAGSAGRSDV